MSGGTDSIYLGIFWGSQARAEGVSVRKLSEYTKNQIALRRRTLMTQTPNPAVCPCGLHDFWCDEPKCLGTCNCHLKNGPWHKAEPEDCVDQEMKRAQAKNIAEHGYFGEKD
jgi:hypothetical protein